MLELATVAWYGRMSKALNEDGKPGSRRSSFYETMTATGASLSCVAL
jgi:hypothetical protein